MEAKGLWMGISCGSIVQFLLLAVITFFSNRQKMVCAFYKPMQVFSFPLINTGHRKKNDL
jgi:hypothetical protein